MQSLIGCLQSLIGCFGTTGRGSTPKDFTSKKPVIFVATTRQRNEICKAFLGMPAFGSQRRKVGWSYNHILTFSNVGSGLGN